MGHLPLLFAVALAVFVSPEHQTAHGASTADVTCTPQGGGYLIRTRAHAAAFPSSCNIIRGNLDITCMRSKCTRDLCALALRVRSLTDITRHTHSRIPAAQTPARLEEACQTSTFSPMCTLSRAGSGSRTATS
jgi:hypothetical protein